MTKSSIAARALPVVLVAAVLGISLVMRPVGLNALNAALCGYGYGYGTQPAVDAVSPTTGPTGGGTPVTLTGCGFTGATSVHFGAAAGTNIAVVSDVKITATIPAHAAGTVDVSVTTPLGTSPAQAGDHFTYAAAGPCTNVTISGTPPSPQPSGTQITIKAVASGCPLPQYEFVYRPASANFWTTAQNFSSNNQFNWDSTHAQTGIVYWGVHAKDASSSGIDALASFPYQTNVVPCSSVTITPSPASPQFAGTPVTWTAVAASCPKPMYEFVYRPASANFWTTAQGFSSSNQFHWNTTGGSGVVYWGVHATDASSTAAVDALASTPFTVNVPACSGTVGLTVVPNPVAHNSSAMITATLTGSCTNGPLYKFVYRPASASDWTDATGFSSTNTFTWNTTGAAAGQIYWGVLIKDSKSPTTTFDVNKSVLVTVT